MIQPSRSLLPFREQSFSTDSNWIQIENLDQNARSICMSLEEFIPSVQHFSSGGSSDVMTLEEEALLNTLKDTAGRICKRTENLSLPVILGYVGPSKPAFNFCHAYTEQMAMWDETSRLYTISQLAQELLITLREMERCVVDDSLIPKTRHHLFVKLFRVSQSLRSRSDDFLPPTLGPVIDINLDVD